MFYKHFGQGLFVTWILNRIMAPGRNSVKHGLSADYQNINMKHET